MKKSVFVVSSLVAGAAATSALAGGFVAGTSFEEPPIFAGTQYVDTGDPLQDHQLFNNADQPFVEYSSVGGELGFTAWYFNTRDGVGLTDGDFVGVTDFTGDVGAYTDGTQGYQMSDADGKMQVRIDTVELNTPTMVSIDYFINGTGWESDDFIRIFVRTESGDQIDILNTSGSDIDDLDVEDRWITGSLDLTGHSTAQLVVELDSNSGSEAIYLDNVRFEKIPAPGALGLLAIAGVVGVRRRRASE